MSTDEDDYWPYVPRFCEIPALFHSLQEEGPFERCVVCDCALVADGQRYVVERIFRGSEPIVEYAMCMRCQDGLSAELSEESLARVQALFRDLNHEARLQGLRPSLEEEQYADWIDHCILTGKPRDECGGYQLVGLFQGRQMELSAVPLMISDEGMEAVMKCLSKTTRDRMEDFMGETFGMPPELCEPDLFPMLL